MYIYNNEGLRLNLDLLDEVRDTAVLRLVVYQQRTAQCYNRKVKRRRFVVGDWCFKRPKLLPLKILRNLCPIGRDRMRSLGDKLGTYRLGAMA